MTEREPNSQKDIADFFKRHRLVRYSANIAWRIALYISIVSTSQGRKVFSNPERRRILFDKEAQVGLLEGAIFNNDLYCPNAEGTSLSHETAVAGRWVGYDFNRPSEFGEIVKKRGRQLFHGRLWTFPLNEIIANPPDKRTSTYLLSPYNIEHLLAMETPTIDDLFKYGFIEETTYKEAYDRVGLYNKFKLFINLENIADKTVYMITPKGNGLVSLEPDFGDRRRELEAKKVLKPAFSF